MSVGPWIVYNKAKKNIASNNALDLEDGVFKMTLHTDSSNAATLTLETYGSVTGEVAEANGYSSSGKTITHSFGVGASAKEYRFGGSPVTFSAIGGTISSIKFAVIRETGGKLVAVCQLSANAFSVTSGNYLRVTQSANGYLEIN